MRLRFSVFAAVVAALVVGAAAPVGLDQARRMLQDDPGAARVSRAADGHFWADAASGSGRVRLLVDTGATAVALTAEDARRLGVDVDRLDFSRTLAGAGGAVRAAEVTLGRLSVGDATVERVKALVVADGLDKSLLGMSYLGRLSKIEATPTEMVLRR